MAYTVALIEVNYTANVLLQGHGIALSEGAMIRAFVVLIAVILFGGGAAEARPLLLISTENGADHVQTRIVQRFVERVNACCADRIDVEHQFGGALYRDRDVIAALTQGKVAMAVVGTWQLDRIAPDVGVFMLPIFYGRTIEEIRAIEDGPAIEAMNRQIEERVGAVVLGRWIGLGFAHVFATRTPLNGAEDLKGLRIRSPGGATNAWRLSALGAEPLTIAWTDLPIALRQGRVDGLITTFASLDSVGLWGEPVRFALEDRQSYSQYVPLLSDHFWRRLDADARARLADAWDQGVREAREMTEAAQAAARARALEAGVIVVSPADERIRATRRFLMERQGPLIARAAISVSALERIAGSLNEGTGPTGDAGR